MAESFTHGYLRLFEIRLLHHYWLDEGATIFDLIAAQDKKDRRLSGYDLRSFASLTPTPATAAILRGAGGVYKETAAGLIVAVPDGTELPLDTVLDFVIRIRDAAFFNYTALTLRPRKVFEIFHPPEKKTYRYKENVPVLSNLSGASRTTGVGKELFLSREFPALAGGDQAESLVASGGALLQLTSDQPGAATAQIGPTASDLPVFVHQGDAPAIVPPPGLTGAPARGIELTDDLPDDLFALLRLNAVRADDADFSYLDGAGSPKAVHPVYQVRLKNRSTTWRYIRSATGVTASQEPSPLPLTFFGNAGSRQKPSAGFVKPVFTGTRITDLISEIFI